MTHCSKYFSVNTNVLLFLHTPPVWACLCSLAKSNRQIRFSSLVKSHQNSISNVNKFPRNPKAQKAYILALHKPVCNIQRWLNFAWVPTQLESSGNRTTVKYLHDYRKPQCKHEKMETSIGTHNLVQFPSIYNLLNQIENWMVVRLGSVYNVTSFKKGNIVGVIGKVVSRCKQ